MDNITPTPLMNPIQTELVQSSSLSTEALPKEEVVSDSVTPKLRYGALFSKKYLGLAFIVVLVGTLVYIWYAWENRQVPVKQFTNVYSFVPEKISKSAMIPIYLPEGVSEVSAKEGITFSPTIEGQWQTEDQDGVIVFAPKQPLRSAVYYAINMDTGSVQMSGDFYVDEDPQVEIVLPASESEAHEDSEITIMFNRPMVPLTTLLEQESKEIPITITPTTPGKWKWISTRNLQFIPETTLIPSSDYVVTIADGLYSVDGLPVAGKIHTFTTRPLRYEFVSSETVGYRSPFIIQFNQAVDIDKTADKIKLYNSDGALVPSIIEYGETKHYDRKSRKEVTEPDPSKLFVYQAKDAHGRKKLWDFDTMYTVSLTGASPLVGTKDLLEERNQTIVIPNIVENVIATSERTTLVRSDFFDPTGTLVITFYEDIDKDRSDFTVKGLKSSVYGERCKKDSAGTEIQLGSGCEKEPDTKTLILTFNPNEFSVGESFDVTLEDIYSQEGFRMNAEPMVITVTAYPAFQILKTFPMGGVATADLDGMYICSTAPLKDPGEDGIKSYIKTSGYIVYGRWSNSEFIDGSNMYYAKCAQGQFQTHFQYGLLPETNYSMTLTLTDTFGQMVTQSFSFRTKSPTEKYTRFHNMQQQYNVTPSDRTKFTYAVENLEYVDMHICKMSPEEFLKRTVNQVENIAPPDSVGCSEVVNERISLPPKYWVNNYFQVDLAKYFPDTRGHYILTFGNPLYKDGYSKSQLFDRTYVSVTNLAVIKKEVMHSDYAWSASTNEDKDRLLTQALASGSNLYWVSNNKTLEPVLGASVIQFVTEGNSSIFQKTNGITDGQGVARTTIEKNLAGAVIRYGGETAVITNWADTLNYAEQVRDASRTYVYTDRPIYRPGHTVNIRGIDRIGFDGSYEVWNKKDGVPLQIYDSRGALLYETRLTQSVYGTFATDFVLPSDAPLGVYRIEVFGQSSTFSVEEYVPAAFKLEATTNQEEYISGDTMQLRVQADYYFGVPLDEGTVSYAVTSQDYYFDKYTDEYFNFGGDWYSCYSCGYGDNFLFRGEVPINADGNAVIEKTLNFKDYFDDVTKEGSKLFTISLTAKDINGRSVSMQKSFVVHKGDFYIGAKTDQYYTSVQTPVTLRVKTVDTKGVSVSLSNIEKTVYKVNWETFKRQEVDGGFYYRSEKRLTEVSKESIKTDASGDWSGTVQLAEEGEYEIQVSKVGSNDTVIQTIAHLYIYGSRAVPVPQNNNYELDIEVEKSNVDVGETASLLIKSPYENAKVLIAIERGTVYEYTIVNLTGGLYVHTFPVRKEYAPNIFVSAVLLSKDPEVKFGSVEYTIGSTEHELSVAVRSDKTHYLPGEKVTLSVETKDATGRVVPAEVSLAVADLSVLALKGNPKKNPLLFFYDGFPLSVTTASNIKNILHEVDIPLGTKGGGGANPDDLAKKKRGLFKDTAFWESSVVTDVNGQATVSFTLPDNLTTWQVESLGVTTDTKLGVDYDEFTTKKDLMAVPLKPRFIVPGDTFSLGAQVFNQTDHDARVDVTLESSSLIFAEAKKDSISVGAGESKTVYFEVSAPNNQTAGEHLFTFTATDGQFVDSVEQSIPITGNLTYETVATANATKDDRAVEYLYVPDEVVNGEGGLTINANATMAVFMTDALAYMATYPYGCSEQLASALSTIGTLTKALTLPNVSGTFDTIEYEGVTYTVATVVNDGLSQLYEAQTLDGGFAYYKGLNANLSLTIHVLTALIDLKRAGYTVEEDVLNRASAFIEQKTIEAYTQAPIDNRETVVLAEYVLRMYNGNSETALTSIVETLINDTAFLNEKISSMSLAYLSILTAEGFSRSNRDAVYTALKNRIDIDGRGAYLKQTNQNSSYFETSIKDTALLLKAFSAHKDEHATTGNVLRWLLASRDARGVWGGTHNTFVVIDAMIDYLAWQHETESSFTLRGLLDGVKIFDFDFNPSTIFKTFTQYIPIDELVRKKLLPVVFERTNRSDVKNNFYYDMALKYYLPVSALPPRDEGITVERGLYALDDTKEKIPLQKFNVGEVIHGKIKLTIPGEYSNVSLEDIIPAGFEIVNFNLDTEDKSLQNDTADTYEEYGMREPKGLMANVVESVASLFGDSPTADYFRSKGFGGSYTDESQRLYPTHVELHDDRLYLFMEQLSPGVYEYEYYLRALVPGEFQHLPARAEQLFFPEVFGRTSGDIITITPSK